MTDIAIIVGAIFAAAIFVGGLAALAIRSANKATEDINRPALYFGECCECGEQTHLDWHSDMCECCKFVKIESPEYLMKLEADMYADQTWRQA